MTFKTILFDWGGVLASGGAPDEMPKRLSRAVGIDAEQLRPLVKELTGMLKTGKITINDFWNQLEQQTEVKVPKSKRNVWATVNELQPERLLVDFTDTLKRRGYKVAILSNTFPNTAADIKAQGWYEPYSPVFLSSSVGLAKPDRAFYQYAIDRLNSQPNEVIFIDDQQKCLDPAAKLGMATVLAKTPQQIVDDIERLLAGSIR